MPKNLNGKLNTHKTGNGNVKTTTNSTCTSVFSKMSQYKLSCSVQEPNCTMIFHLILKPRYLSWLCNVSLRSCFLLYRQIICQL